MKPTRRLAAATVTIAAAGLLAGSAILPGAAGAATTFIGPLTTTTQLASTVPQVNSDVNPYGVFVVPRSTGNLHQGSTLVSNFNDSGNIQGTGTTIVQITPDGTQTLFARINPGLRGCPGGVGLTTALVVLRSGWVIVGSLPTQDGAVSGSGCLIVLDQWGNVRETFAGDGINGPWDMTALDFGAISDLFVTNVLNGTVNANGSTVDGGTVLRITITSLPGILPRRISTTQIGSGFPETLNNAALVIGPTGVGLGPDGTLYVADTLDNSIAAIPRAVFRLADAGTGTAITQNGSLNGPLGLAIAPNGDILTVNSGDGNIVETTPGGTQAAVKTIDTNNGGAGNLFGLAVKPGADAVYFVDDFDNTFDLLH